MADQVTLTGAKPKKRNGRNLMCGPGFNLYYVYDKAHADLTRLSPRNASRMSICREYLEQNGEKLLPFLLCHVPLVW